MFLGSHLFCFYESAMLKDIKNINSGKLAGQAFPPAIITSQKLRIKIFIALPPIPECPLPGIPESSSPSGPSTTCTGTALGPGAITPQWTNRMPPSPPPTPPSLPLPEPEHNVAPTSFIQQNTTRSRGLSRRCRGRCPTTSITTSYGTWHEPVSASMPLSPIEEIKRQV